MKQNWLCEPGPYGPKEVLKEIGMISSASLGVGEKKCGHQTFLECKICILKDLKKYILDGLKEEKIKIKLNKF